MPAGRPKKFKTPAEMQKAIDAYFKSTDEPTICGMAVELGMTRKSLLNYEGREEFLPIIKQAKERIAAIVENLMLYGKSNTSGPIFWMKANRGWTETQHIELTGAGGGPIETRSEITERIKQLRKARKRFDGSD